MARILLLGHRGKLGSALARELARAHELTGRSSADFDAGDFEAVTRMVEAAEPAIVINTVAFVRLDDCERDPMRAARVNTLFPEHLARLGARRGFRLIHFGTESVFSGDKGDFLDETDPPDPRNTYGFTKYMAELAIREALADHLVFRIPVLFGGSVRRGQFLERMIDRARAGEAAVKVADDVITTPTYAGDVARRVALAIDEGLPSGLYHIANSGKASLHDLVAEAFRLLGLETRVERASHRDFPSVARRNTVTPLRMGRLAPLRPWRDALAEYCRTDGAS
jgi:dTDP-4-dehydrorhamnose reductase